MFFTQNMNIKAVNFAYNNKIIKLSFKQDIDYDSLKDSFSERFEGDKKNIAFVKTTKNNCLESIIFKRPIKIKDIFYELSLTKDTFISDELLKHLHSPEDLEKTAIELESSKIGNTKVKSLIGIGAFALVFETEDGNILKITDVNHFPQNRTPDDFDLPIKQKGKIKNCYYYFEEKISQDNLSQDELRELVKHIKDKGYQMKDYLVHYDEENDGATIKTSQFGRAKNGKIYLIDPGCAIAPNKEFFNIKRIKNKLKEKFFKQ